MKLRKIISIIALAVYSVVIAHDFIPHHHHSGNNLNCSYCELEKQEEHTCNHKDHYSHFIQSVDICCANHHQHSFCSFDEETVLTKWIRLSNLFLPSVEMSFDKKVEPCQNLVETYQPFQIKDPPTRKIQLRGPPQLS